MPGAAICGKEHIVPQERMNVIHKEALCVNCGCCVSECNAMESDPEFFGLTFRKGIFYGAARSEVSSTHGQDVFLIGAGAIHWAKKLMADEEIADERHPVGSPQEDKDAALAAFQQGTAESGFVERKMVRRTLIGALLQMLRRVPVLNAEAVRIRSAQP